MYRIGELAALSGLSRSTLLYYDRIGLLMPSGRTESNYRCYSAADRERLETICSLRQAGIDLTGIRAILTATAEESSVLQRRLGEIGREMQALHTQQRIVAEMLAIQSGVLPPVAVDKHAWIDMLRVAGMDERAMEQWHTEFERRAPQAHHTFLVSLGIDEEEISLIRRRSVDKHL